MTKMNRQRVDNYNRATATELWQLYGKFSENKAHAFNYCKELQAKKNGYGFKVFGANCHQFSAGFLFKNENGKECLMYITKSEDRVIELED